MEFQFHSQRLAGTSPALRVTAGWAGGDVRTSATRPLPATRTAARTLARTMRGFRGMREDFLLMAPGVLGGRGGGDGRPLRRECRTVSRTSMNCCKLLQQTPLHLGVSAAR